MRAPSTEALPDNFRSAARGVSFPPGRPTAAFIDLNALTHNFREVLRLGENRKVLAVVKAQAYGHGSVPVARRLLELGADMLGVALVEEGKELRSAGIQAPVLVMGALFRIRLNPSLISA